MVFSDKHLVKCISWKHLCCCVAGSRSKQYDSHKGRLSAMSTFDAATATLIADRYLRQQLNTRAISIPGDHRKVTAQGNKYTHAPTDRNSCQASFSPVSRVWHLLSTAKVVCGAPTAAGGWQGHQGLLVPTKMPRVQVSSFVLKGIYSMWQGGIPKASLHVLHTDWGRPV